MSRRGHRRDSYAGRYRRGAEGAAAPAPGYDGRMRSTDPPACACCGDERVVTEAWGEHWCIDCDRAGCDASTCRATVPDVQDRIAADQVSL